MAKTPTKKTTKKKTSKTEASDAPAATTKKTTRKKTTTKKTTTKKASTTKKTTKKTTTKKAPATTASSSSSSSSRSSSSRSSSGRSSSSRSSSSRSSSSRSSKKPEQSVQMLVNYVPGDECRVAFVSDGMLEEYDAERPATANSVGNIYVGTVTNVESAIQAAFVDFGHESNGFLHVTDLHPQYFPGEDQETTEKIGRKTPRRDRPPIQQCLKRGQKVLVQVIKEGIGTKGPTVSSYLSIPGRYLVMLPQMDKVGVSRKVEDEDLRKKGRTILDSLDLPENFGFILRTAGLEQTKTELKRDLSYLKRLWTDIDKRLKETDGKRQKRGDMAGRLLYAESDLLMRVLRDRWDKDVTDIVIDHPSALTRAARFMKIVAPRSDTRLLHYDKPAPIFHAYGLEEQIQRMHEREVPLPGGGSLVIDETEAMIAIDVNSGKLRKHGDAETTAYETNKQAVEEICRQLRLRDIGGLVVCDLIDMMKRSNRKDIEDRIEERLKRDRAASKALPISQFGMVEMTRQRMKGSLRSQHFTKCPACAGRGLVRRPSSVASDTLRDIAALLDHDRIGSIEVVVSPRVAGELLSTGRVRLTKLEHRAGKDIQVRVKDDMQVDRVVFYAYDEQGADVAIEKLPLSKSPRDLPVWTDTGLDAEADAALDQREDIDADGFDVQAIEEHHESEDAMLDAMPGIDVEDPKPAQRRGREDRDGESEGEGDGKKKRRRRRRGGRGRRRDDSDGERSEEPRGERTEETASDDNEQAQEERPQQQREDREGAEEGDSGRKRRRRRGGRGRRKSGDGDDNTAEQPRERAPRSARDRDAEAEDDGVDIAPADNSERGDSWDLTPEEFDAKYPRPDRRNRKKVSGRKQRSKAEERPITREDVVVQQAPEPEPEPTAQTENGTTMIKKRRERKAPAKRAPAKSAVVEETPDGPEPVVKKRRSLFGSRRAK